MPLAQCMFAALSAVMSATVMALAVSTACVYRRRVAAIPLVVMLVLTCDCAAVDLTFVIARMTAIPALAMLMVVGEGAPCYLTRGIDRCRLGGRGLDRRSACAVMVAAVCKCCDWRNCEQNKRSRQS